MNGPSIGEIEYDSGALGRKTPENSAEQWTSSREMESTWKATPLQGEKVVVDESRWHMQLRIGPSLEIVLPEGHTQNPSKTCPDSCKTMHFR